MSLTADDRAVIQNLTEEIKGVKESLNFLNNTAFTENKAVAFLNGINTLSTSIEKLAGMVNVLQEKINK
jgi:hypothetical protein